MARRNRGVAVVAEARGLKVIVSGLHRQALETAKVAAEVVDGDGAMTLEMALNLTPPPMMVGPEMLKVNVKHGRVGDRPLGMAQPPSAAEVAQRATERPSAAERAAEERLKRPGRGRGRGKAKPADTGEGDAEYTAADIGKALTEGAAQLTPKGVYAILEEFGVGSAEELGKEQYAEFIERVYTAIEETA